MGIRGNHLDGFTFPGIDPGTSKVLRILDLGGFKDFWTLVFFGSWIQRVLRIWMLLCFSGLGSYWFFWLDVGFC